MSETSRLPLTFYGADAEECEEFIRLVRIHAFDKGKEDDDAWIAKQVYPCFGGKALRWYLKQPRDIRGDWELLQQALIEKWPEVEDESSLQPTPASAPPSTGNRPRQLARRKAPNSATPRLGRISVKVPNNPRLSGYLSRNVSRENNEQFRGCFCITTDFGESLEVELLTTETPNIWRLGVKDLPGVEYLAAYPPGGTNFKVYTGVVIGVQKAPSGLSGDSTTYASTTALYMNHQYHTDVWEIGNQGALTLRWRDESGSSEISILVYYETHLGLNEYIEPSRKAELAFVESSS